MHHHIILKIKNLIIILFFLKFILKRIKPVGVLQSDKQRLLSTDK